MQINSLEDLSEILRKYPANKKLKDVSELKDVKSENTFVMILYAQFIKAGYTILEAQAAIENARKEREKRVARMNKK